MTTTETQTIISEQISGPYMVLQISHETQLVLGRSRYPSTSLDLKAVTVIEGNVVGIDVIPRAEAIRAMDLLKTLI